MVAMSLMCFEVRADQLTSVGQGLRTAEAASLKIKRRRPNNYHLFTIAPFPRRL